MRYEESAENFFETLCGIPVYFVGTFCFYYGFPTKLLS